MFHRCGCRPGPVAKGWGEIWSEFAAALGEHSAGGSALTMRGVQASRPSLYALRGELSRIAAPVLILAGDEDEGCLEPALMLERTIPAAGLVVLPQTGHTANLEEPGGVQHGRGPVPGRRRARCMAAA
jgi:pimeloyl-ACP methyl ester carboxylesterase